MSIERNEIIFEIDAKLNFNEILKRIDIIKKTTLMPKFTLR